MPGDLNAIDGSIVQGLQRDPFGKLRAGSSSCLLRMTDLAPLGSRILENRKSL